MREERDTGRAETEGTRGTGRTGWPVEGAKSCQEDSREERYHVGVGGGAYWRQQGWMWGTSSAVRVVIQRESLQVTVSYSESQLERDLVPTVTQFITHSWSTLTYLMESAVSSVSSSSITQMGKPSPLSCVRLSHERSVCKFTIS
ncbi:Hypothetical predicted protein [Marmota monax]|uniref:Uncharacterized protein n=1 Tax=Marmota monax TaxID=9995 RepID=A0A5E4A4C8_MARMO|nr:hypothetical protein GHT09_000574 [Marmota monax]VTJ52087.1 Hypothetical predicted protein [Marmota monax]